MNITFLIGNGFDLGLGLDTSYPDFIKWYLKQDISENAILQNFKEKIAQDLATWGDAELAFGQFPFSELGENVEENLRICVSDFQENLCEYLKMQGRRINEELIKPETCTLFRMGLITLLGMASNKFTVDMLSKIDFVEVNIINFNYTRAFDALFSMDTTMAKMDSLMNGKEITFPKIRGLPNVSFGRTIHAHGELSRPADLLFGVNDCSQIGDWKVAEMGEREGHLIKPAMAQEDESIFYNTSKEILEASDILALFGLSYGATDKIWWDEILDIVARDGIQVILCPYENPPMKARSFTEKKRIEFLEIERFLKHTKFQQDSSRDTLPKGKIKVVPHGPYPDLETQEECYCDPLHLNYFGRHYVKDFNREPIRTARQN